MQRRSCPEALFCLDGEILYKTSSCAFWREFQMDLHIITFSSFWSLSHFILFLNCAFRHELPMNPHASRSHVLIFISKPPLRITKVKMCCGPHAVSVARGLCHISNEILTFFLRSEDDGGRCKKARPFFYTCF